MQKASIFPITTAAGAFDDVPSIKTTRVVNVLDEDGNLRPFDAIEADVLDAALSHCRQNVTEAARALGIGRTTLYRRGLAKRPKPEPAQ